MERNDDESRTWSDKKKASLIFVSFRNAAARSSDKAEAVWALQMDAAASSNLDRHYSS